MLLKGPAFPDREGPGMSVGGGLWPVRYTNYCGGLFEDIDEDEVRTDWKTCDIHFILLKATIIDCQI